MPLRDSMDFGEVDHQTPQTIWDACVQRRRARPTPNLTNETTRHDTQNRRMGNSLSLGKQDPGLKDCIAWLLA